MISEVYFMVAGSNSVDVKPKKTPSYLEAERMLPPELHLVLEQLVSEYRFASLKHHGRMFASPKVIAELILIGWRSPQQ